MNPYCKEPQNSGALFVEKRVFSLIKYPYVPFLNCSWKSLQNQTIISIFSTVHTELKCNISRCGSDGTQFKPASA